MTPVFRKLLAPTFVLTLTACTHQRDTTAAASAPTAKEKIWNVTVSDGKCSATPADCEYTSPCNPFVFACPAALAPDASPITITRPAGSDVCTLTSTRYFIGGTCPTGATCSPPAPHHETMNVACPK